MVNHILNQQNEKWRLWVEYPDPQQPSAKGQAEHPGLRTWCAPSRQRGPSDLAVCSYGNAASRPGCVLIDVMVKYDIEVASDDNHDGLLPPDGP